MLAVASGGVVHHHRWTVVSLKAARIATVCALAGALQLPATLTAQDPVPPPPNVASLGTCTLTSGAIIRNCRVGYRTFGRLNAARSNGVLIPTWLLGRTDQWIPLLGPDGLVDTTRFFTILVEALGNGVSSSPSNSSAEDRGAFRGLTIGDMVDTQHRLVVDHLKLPRLHAVMGISMGGFQSFEWAVRYPGFMDVVIPIAGSPRIAAYDHTVWTMQMSQLKSARTHRIPDDSTWTQIARTIEIFGQTPRAVNDSSAAAADRDVEQTAQFFRQSWKLEDFEAQLGAGLRQDVSARFGGDMTRAAAQVRAPMLIVYSWDDHMVTAEPAAAFAKLVRADTLSIHSKCGHVAAGCEAASVNPVVRRFLER